MRALCTGQKPDLSHPLSETDRSLRPSPFREKARPVRLPHPPPKRLASQIRLALRQGRRWTRVVSVRAARSKGNTDLPDKRDPAIAARISYSLSIVVAFRKARGEREIAEIAAVPSITAVIYVTGRGPAWATARSTEPAAAAITRSYDSAISTRKATPIIRVRLAAKAAARAASAGIERGNVTSASSYPTRSHQDAGAVLIVSQNLGKSSVTAPAEYAPAVTYYNGVGEHSARRYYYVDTSLAVTATATAAAAGTAVTACPRSAITPSATGTARSPRLYLDRDRSPRRAVDGAR